MYTAEQIKEAGLDDFRTFLRQAWDYLMLPAPTAVQNDIAHYLQHGPRRRIIEAFRGVGKSWITVAFACWRLLLDPQLKIMVVSANEQTAALFTRFCLQLIRGMEILNHLEPRADQLKSSELFNVDTARDSKDPSVKSVGLKGQLTGSRADIIVADDIEVPKNSLTHVMREQVAELVKEFDSVLKPGGQVIYLGTPQVEASLYNRLPERGYEIRVWPVQVPDNSEAYHGRLAPFIQKKIEKGAPAGTPIDPLRFPRSEIDERRASHGLAGFALQYMLDTNPSDADKHPLKTRDLIVHDVDADVGHVKLVWGADRQALLQDLHSGGLEGDCYYHAVWKSEEMTPFQGTVMAIDPSGRGGDETSYGIVSYLGGMLYLRDVGGFTDGFGELALRGLATRAIRHRVNYWIAEENYGGGMFAQLLKPVMIAVAKEAKLDPDNPDPKARPPGFDEEYDGWSSTQKELRILDTLEPLLRQHRLVVDRRVIEEDLKVQQEKPRYSFIHQMTRMARIKGILPNEDRLEAVSMACSYWTARMARDKDRALDDHRSAKLDEELRRFKQNAISVGRRLQSSDGRHDNRYLYWRK